MIYTWTKFGDGMVEITRLRMRNFKSFRKADVPLKRGFTCIAGANATGKSNICDALLFVFGVTSLKMLRASRLTDLVNHEAEDGTAKVEVEVKNNGTIYEISRTIDRQGKSVVRLNGKRAGLNEVSALLLELGIQPTGHNVVVQGDVTRIIEMNAKQRKGIIDEISGIAEFEDKKEEAMKKLGEVGKKIEDVAIVLKERTTFLEEMEKEREAALKYQEMSEELQRSRATIIVEEIRRLKSEMEATGSKIEAKEKELGRCKEQQSELKEEEQTLEQQMDEVTRQMIEQSEQTYLTVGKKMEEARGKLHVAQERVQNSERELQKKQVQLEALKEKRGNIQARRKEKEQKIRGRKEELAAHSSRMEGLEEQEKEQLGKMEEKGKQLATAEQGLREQRARLERAKEQWQENKIREAAGQRELEVLAREAEQLRETLSQFGFEERIAEVGKLKEWLRESNQTLERVMEAMNRVKNKTPGIRSEMEGIQDMLEKWDSTRRDLMHSVGRLNDFLQAVGKEGGRSARSEKEEKVNEQLNAFRKQVVQGKEQVTALEREVFALEEKVASFRKAATVTGIRELAEWREKKGLMHAEMATLEAEVRNLSEKEEEVEEEQQLTKNEQDMLRQEIKQHQEAAIKQQKEVEQQEAMLQKNTQAHQLLEEKKGRLATRMRNTTDKRGELEIKREKIDQAINQIHIEQSKNEVRVADMEQEMPAFEGVEPYPGRGVAELRQRVGVLEKEIKGLGAVNMKALEGFEQYQQEVHEIEGRVSKLEEEKRAVMEMIDKIELKKVQVFMDCFNMVNDNFERLYYSFFGGEGKLQLTDPLNPSESGLEIHAHYKEDKMKSIDAMSGGEKTLTALAFLFAIQSYTPAPFYIFDEVDAALDKDNSLKLARMLNEIGKKSQFISITHNDLVIKNADQIIGVALNKQKSSVIGLKLKEKLEELAA